MNKNIYNEIYTEGHLQNISSVFPRIIKMLAMANELNLKNKNILDIGCHDGTFLSLLDDKSAKLYGLEASEAAAKISRQRKIKTKSYFFDDVTPMPFPDKSFDLIIAGEIIEHIYNTDFFVQEIHRLLKPKGHLLISTPNIASLGRRVFLLLGINPLLEVSITRAETAGHIRYFTFNSLNKLISDNHFQLKSYSSDIINLNNTGTLRSKILGQVFPHLGQSIICVYQKV